jgi:hypothetical protein
MAKMGFPVSVDTALVRSYCYGGPASDKLSAYQHKDPPRNRVDLVSCCARKQSQLVSKGHRIVF